MITLFGFKVVPVEKDRASDVTRVFLDTASSLDLDLNEIPSHVPLSQLAVQGQVRHWLKSKSILTSIRLTSMRKLQTSRNSLVALLERIIHCSSAGSTSPRCSIWTDLAGRWWHTRSCWTWVPGLIGRWGLFSQFRTLCLNFLFAGLCDW